MKRTTAIMTTLALMLAMVSCNGGTNEPEVTTAGTTVGQGLAPAVTTETTEQTTVMTTVETSVETEETTAAVTENVFPEFDINSEECLMYRLLDMTVDEIEAEFRELTLHSFSHGVPNPEYRLSLNGTECYEITYFYKDADDKGNLYDGVLPLNVFVVSNSVDISPNIKKGQKTDEVSCAVARWDVGRIHPDGIGSVTTVLYVDNYEFCVMWDTPDDMKANLKRDIEGKSDEEKETICQSYADEFLKNFKTVNTKVKNIYVKKK